MIIAEKNLFKYLGKDLDSLVGKVYSPTMQKLRAYAENEEGEFYKSVRYTGLSLVDYLFLSVQQGNRSIDSLANEVGINGVVLGGIFDNLSLPRLTRSEYGIGRREEREKIREEGIEERRKIISNILYLHGETGGNATETGRRVNYNRGTVTYIWKKNNLEPMQHGGARLRQDGNRWERIGKLEDYEAQQIVDIYKNLKRVSSYGERKIINMVAERLNHTVPTVERYVGYWNKHGHIGGSLPPLSEDEDEIVSVFKETGNMSEVAKRTFRTAPSIIKVLKKHNLK